MASSSDNNDMSRLTSPPIECVEEHNTVGKVIYNKLTSIASFISNVKFLINLTSRATNLISVLAQQIIENTDPPHDWPTLKQPIYQIVFTLQNMEFPDKFIEGQEFKMRNEALTIAQKGSVMYYDEQMETTNKVVLGLRTIFDVNYRNNNIRNAGEIKIYKKKKIAEITELHRVQFTAELASSNTQAVQKVPVSLANTFSQMNTNSTSSEATTTTTTALPTITHKHQHLLLNDDIFKDAAFKQAMMTEQKKRIVPKGDYNGVITSYTPNILWKFFEPSLNGEDSIIGQIVSPQRHRALYLKPTGSPSFNETEFFQPHFREITYQDETFLDEHGEHFSLVLGILAHHVDKNCIFFETCIKKKCSALVIIQRTLMQSVGFGRFFRAAKFTEIEPLHNKKFHASPVSILWMDILTPAKLTNNHFIEVITLKPNVELWTKAAVGEDNIAMAQDESDSSDDEEDDETEGIPVVVNRNKVTQIEQSLKVPASSSSSSSTLTMRATSSNLGPLPRVPTCIVSPTPIQEKTMQTVADIEMMMSL